MLKLIGNKIQMVKGDFGLPLPITLEQTIASDETIKFTIEDSKGKEILVKKYSNITDNQFELSFTKEESEKLKAKTYLYKIDWYKEDVFKGNIVRDEIFEVLGNNDEYEEEEIILNLQTKTVIPTKEQQSITYDEEYDALGEVIVEPIPEEYIKPEGTLEITENGKYDVKEKSEVNVDVAFDGVTISDASYLFSNNARLEQINELLSMCKNVDNTARMFDNASELTEIDLTNLDVSNVTNMYYMFNTCINLTQVNVSNFNTSKVTNFSYMFAYCSKLTEIDLSSFYTSNTANTSYMFRNCSKLAKIIINNPNVFRMSNVNMLENTPIKNGTGYVYVPDNLVETYKTATNWSSFASQIKGISELEETE